MPIFGNTPRSKPSLFEEEDERTEFRKGIESGIDQVQALGGGFLALAGSAIGNDDLFYSGLDYYNEQMAEAAESQADVGRIEDIDGFDDFLSYVSYTAGNAIPSLATIVAGGGIGGVAARAAVKKGIQQKAREYADNRVKDQAADAFKKRVANDYANAALSTVARRGAQGGAFAAGSALGAGESFTRILEENNEEAPGVALVTGLISGSLDALAPMSALKRIFPKKEFESAREAIAAEAERRVGLFSRVIRESGKQAGVEGVTEAMQEAVQTIASEYVENNYSDLSDAFNEALFDETKKSAYINAFAAGVIGGGGFGGITGLATRDPATTSRISKEELQDVDRRVDEENERLDQLGDRAREEEAIPERIASFDGVASARQRQADIRDRVRRQMDARLKVKSIITDAETIQDDPAVDAEPDLPQPVETPTPTITEPESATPLSSIVGNNVRFGDAEGILTRRDDGFFVVTPDSDIFVESGEAATAESLGITQIDPEVVLEGEVTFNPDDSTFILRGKKFTYLRTNKDSSGNTVSIQAVDNEGNRRTIREPEVVSRIERQKADSEEPVARINIPLDVLSGRVQEDIVDDAEANNTEIPDEILAETALEKALKLDGLERELALEKLDEFLVMELQKGIRLTQGATEVTRPTAEPNRFRKYISPAIDRAKTVTGLLDLDRGKEIVREALAENNKMSQDTLERQGTGDYYSPQTIPEGDFKGINEFGFQDYEAADKSFRTRIIRPNSPQANVLGLALVDLVSLGMPTSWFSDISSFGYYNKSDQRGDAGVGAYVTARRPTGELVFDHLVIRNDVVTAVKQNSGKLRYVLAHELAHAADAKNNITERLPGFQATVVNDGTDDVVLDAGEIVSELYNVYTSGTEFGLELAYPFAFLEPKTRQQMTDDDSLVNFLKSELFAQASAAFFTSPKTLKDEAPKTYRLISDLVADGMPDIENIVAAETDQTYSGVRDGEDQNTEESGFTTSPVSGDVRASTEPRGIPRRGRSRDGEEGQGGLEEGQAREVVGAEAISRDGVDQRPGVREEGTQDPRLEDADVTVMDMVVSTRFPTAVRATEDPVNNTIVNTYDSFKQSPVFEKNMKLVKKYNNLTKQEALRKDESAAEALIEHAKDNLLDLYDRVPTETRERSKLWYVGANRLARELSSQYSVGNEQVTLAQASAVLANLSPQKDWYMNADLGRRVMDAYFNHYSDPFDSAMKEKAEQIYFNGSQKTQEENRELLQVIGDRSLEEIWNDQSLSDNKKNQVTAFWIRTYDEAYNPRSYPIVTPEGDSLGPSLNADGSESSVAWGSFNEISKAVSVLRNGNQENITRSLGSANKVRNFYNNIFDPESEEGFVTIDTHAVAASLLKPLSGNSKEVAHNFGGQHEPGQPGASNSIITGHNGTYSLFEEAYRRAATERGVLPREMQSITWEAVRGLFSPSYKADENNVNYIESIWNDYRRRKITLDEARGLIYEHAQGIQPPAWDGSGARLDDRGGQTIEQRDLPDVSFPRQGLGSEQAPDAGRGTDATGVSADLSVTVRDLPDLEPDVSADTEALNARIREENQPKFERVKKTFKRLLSPGGLLPKQVFDAKIERDSQLGAVEIDIRQILREFDDAVKDAYGRDLDEVEQQQVHDALTKDFANIDNLGLDTDVKNAVVMMRKYLDNMSVEYAQVLFKEAQELAATGKDAAAAAKIDLIKTIVGNTGQYLHRSYRAFDDPNWANNVPDEVLNAARDYLTENGTTNVENVLNQILKEGTAFDSMEAFIRESKLGAKDLSILKRRKDIAPEIRALLGEYIDPKINFTKSATKMSRLLFNDRFLKRVKDEGLGVFLFDDETAPPEAYQKFASDQSDVLSPLNGLRSTPEVVQAFQDSLGKEQMADWYRAIVRTNGLIKYGKTVIAPTTIARNFLSAYMFTLANGHFNLAKSAESIANLQSYFKTKGDKVKYMRRLRELGVVYDTPYAGEMMALLDDSKFEVFMEGKLQGAKNFFDNATRFYQFGDDFWKIVGFENEIDILMDKKGISREEAEPIAAERIRNTYPTYSMVGLGIQKLRRFPLVGTFVSFPAEMIRTSFNMIKYLQRDLNDPDMSSIVPQRIAGLSMVSAGVYALQEALKDMVDVDEDEEEAVRILGPDWSRNSNLAFLGRSEGKLQYVDMSAFDPYNYFKRPLNALLRNQPVDDAVYQAAQELLQPFFGQDIAFQNIVEIWQNEKGSGGSVYNEEDSSTEQLEAIVGHIIKGIGPSVVQNINRTYKALEGERNAAGRVYKLEDEMAALTGLRVTTLDPKVSLHFKAYDFNQAKRDATRILTSTFRDINDVSDAELKDSFVRASTARKEAFERMIKIVEAARRSGLSRSEIISVLRSNGISKKDAIALEGGVADSWSLSDTTLKNSVQKADLLFGEATGREYERRWSLVQSLMEDE